MKQFLILIHVIMLCLMVSCMGSNEATFANDYIDACAENDFARANSIIDKMMVDSEQGIKYSMDDHKKYVLNKEIMYLVSQGDEYSADRLVFLLNENDNLDYSPTSIMNVALNQKNAALLLKLIESGVEVSSDFISNVLSSSLDPDAIIVIKEKYASSLLKSISSCADQMPSSVPAGTRYFSGTGYDTSAFEKRIKNYNEAANKLNGLCNKLVSFAIQTQENKLANDAILRMVEILEIIDEGWKNNGKKYYYTIVKQSEDIQAAKSRVKSSF